MGETQNAAEWILRGGNLTFQGQEPGFAEAMVLCPHCPKKEHWTQSALTPHSSVLSEGQLTP